MSESIPTYRLQAFANDDTTIHEVFFPEYGTARPTLPLDLPYRGDYYKISLCVQGTASLNVNLETYVVTPGCLILATPEVIKQWRHISDDYETLSVFFTKNFITTNNAATGKLRFFLNPPTYVLSLAAPEAASIAASFHFLQQKYRTPNAQRSNILKNILNSLLYEIGAFYDQHPTKSLTITTRSQLLTAAFQQLVQMHSCSERRVQFYADQLCITPKHLSELVKTVTGRTAGEWIADAVMLEAKALLQNAAFSIQQVAASLQFADQFAFSRFFKKSTGLSPTAYRQLG